MINKYNLNRLKIRNLFRHDIWNIGIVKKPIHFFLEQSFKPKIHWLPVACRKDFKADPFGINIDGKLYIFFEKFDFNIGKGRIDYISLKNSCLLNDTYLCCNSNGSTNLSDDEHISYPYIFQRNKSIYCIPETARKGEISLYKAINFPHTWTKIQTLINIPAVDNTLFFHNNFWWIACSLTRQYDSLYLYFAPSILGPWQPHRKNPVKKDLRSARPGGTPFYHNENIYRPAQDCTETYGGAIVINKILKLTPYDFQEEIVKIVRPDNQAFNKGMHTISSIGNFTLLDGKKCIISFSETLKIIIRKLKLLIN